MFQDPSRRKEGMNLEGVKERKVKKSLKRPIVLLLDSLLCKRVLTLYRRPWVPHVAAC